MYDFHTQEKGELPFSKGDRVLVTERNDANWWTGTNVRTKKSGLFPVNYVKKLQT